MVLISIEINELMDNKKNNKLEKKRKMFIDNPIQSSEENSYEEDTVNEVESDDSSIDNQFLMIAICFILVKCNYRI